MNVKRWGTAAGTLVVLLAALSIAHADPIVPSGCPEATNFLARTSGLDSAHVAAYTNLICGLVQDGVWPKLDALYVFATQDMATSLLNLVSTNYTAVNYFADFDPDKGWDGDGVDDAIDTTFDPSHAGGHYSRNSAHLSAYVLNATNNPNPVIGYLSSGVFTQLWPGSSAVDTFMFINHAGGGGPIAPGTHGPGFYLMNRTNASTSEGYFNDTLLGTSTSPSAKLEDGTVHIEGDAHWGQGQQSALFSDRKISFATIGGALTPAEEANLYARLQSYREAIIVDTSCQITTLTCPSHPGSIGTFTDDFQHASGNQNRCMQRAQDYYDFCLAGGSVSASYFSRGTLLASTTYPAPTPPPPPSPSPTIASTSPNGTTITAPTSDTITNGNGHTFSFGGSSGNNYIILRDGTQYASGAAVTLAIQNGVIWAYTAIHQWWSDTGLNWVAQSSGPAISTSSPAPTPTFTPTPSPATSSSATITAPTSQSLTDANGHVFSFGGLKEYGPDYYILRDGNFYASGASVSMTLSNGIIWAFTAANQWWSDNGSWWIGQSAPPPTYSYTPTPPPTIASTSANGASITAPTNETLTDANGHVFSFGGLKEYGPDYYILRDGNFYASGASVSMTLSNGIIWAFTAANQWWSDNGSWWTFQSSGPAI